MNIIVFSKDRAAQLDLFLRSMEEYFPEYYYHNFNIIYTYSNQKFKKGYEELIKLYNNVKFIKETDFKKNILNKINKNIDYTVFFVDDIIWKEPFSTEDNEFHTFEVNKDILCLSLRLNPNLNYCYTANKSMSLPKTYNKGIWEWKGESGDYGYPMSLDGHIFRTKEILPYLKKLNYKNPNSLEGSLASFPLSNPKMICYDKSKIVNNAINKVQTNNPNRHGNVTADYINNKFLEGYMIDLDPFRNMDNKQCHIDEPIKFIKDE